jgi:hypothetical protein
MSTKLEREQARAAFEAAVAAKLKAAGRRGSNPETALTRSILDALALVRGWVLVMRANSGRVRTERGGLVQLAPTGTADILGCLAPGGRLIGLEVKTPTGRVTPAQVAWAERIRNVGGFVATVRSVPEALAAVSRAKGGERE